MDLLSASDSSEIRQQLSVILIRWCNDNKQSNKLLDWTLHTEHSYLNLTNLHMYFRPTSVMRTFH